MKVKIKQPTSLKDIKLSQYQQFVKTTKDIEDVNFINRQIVGIFCNLPDKIVGNISRKDFNRLVVEITEILESKSEFKQFTTYNGVKYGFIPKLDDITVDEQADIDSMINDWDKMDKVMGVMYRPVTHERKGKYLIEEYKENKPLDLTLDVVFGAMVFFYDLLKDLLSYIQKFINQEVTKIRTLQILEKNGVGIKTFTHSLEEIFSNLMKLESSNYIKPYYSWHLKQKKTNLKAS